MERNKDVLSFFSLRLLGLGLETRGTRVRARESMEKVGSWPGQIRSKVGLRRYIATCLTTITFYLPPYSTAGTRVCTKRRLKSRWDKTLEWRRCRITGTWTPAQSKRRKRFPLLVPELGAIMCVGDVLKVDS